MQHPAPVCQYALLSSYNVPFASSYLCVTLRCGCFGSRSRTLGDNGDIRKRGALRRDASYGASAGSHGGDPSPRRRPFFGPSSVRRAGAPPEPPELVAIGSRSSVVPGASFEALLLPYEPLGDPPASPTLCPRQLLGTAKRERPWRSSSSRPPPSSPTWTLVVTCALGGRTMISDLTFSGDSGTSVSHLSSPLPFLIGSFRLFFFRSPWCSLRAVLSFCPRTPFTDTVCVIFPSVNPCLPTAVRSSFPHAFFS